MSLSKMRCTTTFSISLQLLFLVLILGVVIERSESGRILRAWRRNGNSGPRSGRSPWSQFFTHRRSFYGGRRRLPPIHHLRQELAAGRADTGVDGGAGAGTPTSAVAVKHPPQPQPQSHELLSAGERRAFTAADGKVLGEASVLKPIDPSTAAVSGISLNRHPAALASRRSSWPFTNAVGRSPIFDYVPASSEKVKFVTETQQRRAGVGQARSRPPPSFRRRPPMPLRPRLRRPPHPHTRKQVHPPANRFQWNRRKTQYTREPPLIWKLLASRRNRWRNFWRPSMPPPPHRRPATSQEAESQPYMPHIVFFQHGDQMDSKNETMVKLEPNSTITTSNSSSVSVLRPGKVTSVPLYPVQPSSPSEFIPIPSATPGKEYIFRVVELKHLKRPTTSTTTTNTPVPVSDISITSSPVYKSAPPPPPFEPMPTTSSEVEENVELDPPAPIDNIQINIDAQAEGSEHFLQVVPPPSTTTPTTTTSSTTLKPIFALREEPAHVEEIMIPRNSAEAKPKKPGFQHLLPTYNSNKKSTGLAPKKHSSSKEYRESREEIGSSIMITGIRSKVKEYKPQLLANFSQLIAFDKVITPVVEVMSKPIKPAKSYGFSSRSNADEVVPASETTVTSPEESNADNASSANANNSNSSSSEEAAAPSVAAVEVTNSTMSVSSSSSESVSYSNSNNQNEVSPEVSEDSDSSSPTTTLTSTESPMERFDPLKLIHSWFMKT